MCAKTASDAKLTFKVQKANTLLDIEDMIHSVTASKARSVDFWLAKDLGSQLFKDTRIVCLFAAAASRGIHTRVIDWLGNPDERHLAERFGETLEGLGSLEYGDEIVDAKKYSIDTQIRHYRLSVVEKNGIKTPEKTYGKSLTFCAFDPEMPTPVGFAGISGKSDFIRRFLQYRRTCFEIGVGEGFSDQVPEGADRAIASFAYELWQNAFQHGRLDKDNRDIKGMRYLRVQKHIGHNKRMFIQRAAGFPELRSYLTREIPASGTFKFYEITIGDNGLGIVERFLATRPEFASGALTYEESASLLNRIINESLSSKRSQSGAGHGLEQAIAAVLQLRGFVSIRSGSLWLYYAAGEDANGQVKSRLLSVRHQSTLASVGTQFNLIFPLTNHRIS